MTPFEISALVYVLLFMGLGLWAVIIAKMRLGKIPTSIADWKLVGKESTSPWDPFHPIGSKRWQIIQWLMFLLVAALLFTTG